MCNWGLSNLKFSQFVLLLIIFYIFLFWLRWCQLLVHGLLSSSSWLYFSAPSTCRIWFLPWLQWVTRQKLTVTNRWILHIYAIKQSIFYFNNISFSKGDWINIWNFTKFQKLLTKHQKLTLHRSDSTFSFDDPLKLNVTVLTHYTKRTPIQREMLARTLRNASVGKRKHNST